MKACGRCIGVMVMLLALSTSGFAEDGVTQDQTKPVETAVATVEPQSTEDSSVSISSTQSQDDLLLSGEPLAYGDEAFRQRILQRTGGKRPAIGLVLSGGSARAMAHIGVLKYLEEQGIVPDYIVSNSMGSIVGLLYAAGMSPGQIERCISTMDLSKVISFTLPLEGGLLKADSLASYAVSLLNGSNTKSLRLEDLSIPIIVVQEDLVTKRQILVSEGDFATILRASFAIPVYFPSVEYQGHLLIDGGITNLAPINVAYQYSDDVIVSTTFNTRNDLNLRNPLTAVNTMLDIQKRRTGVNEIIAHPEMIWIRCDVEKISFMDFANLDAIAQKGYEAAKAQQEALSKLPSSLGVVSLKERRDDLEKSIDQGIANFSLYNHVRQTKLSNTFSFEFSSYLTDDASYLKDSGALGLAYQLKWGNFAFYALGASSLTTYRDQAFSASPMIATAVTYHAWNHTRLTFLLDTNLDQGTAVPSVYLRANVESRYHLLGDHLIVRGIGSAELLRSEVEEKTFVGTTMMANAGVLSTYQDQKGNGEWNFSGSSLDVFVQGFGNTDSFRPFFAVRSSLQLAHRPSSVFLNLASTFRFALDGQGNVPLFAKDGFRTNSLEIRREGHGAPSNPSNVLVAANVTLGWKPEGFKPTVAEAVILKNTSIAGYFDFLWINEAYFSTGIQMTINPSFLGLKDFPLTMFCGYENATGGIVWGFWLSSAL